MSKLTNLVVAALLTSTVANAATVNMVSGSTGKDLEFLKERGKIWEQQTGHTLNVVAMPSSTTDQFGLYRQWLAAGNTDVDVYQTDVIWAPQLADQFIDLSSHASDVVNDHFPSIIESQTVNGRLVALPAFTDAPALYYRTDLLSKYGKQPPKTWDEMAAIAKEIMDKERAAGNADMWGFVFQGSAYEGLTCDALEWVKSNGGGQIVEADGSISINNPKAIEAIDRAATWVGTISPDGVLAYMEEESRGVWQLGNSVFMRNWPYAFALGNSDDSPIKGKFDVVPLPSGGGAGSGSAATLGGWNLAVSKYSPNQDAAISLVKFLASTEHQTANAIQLSKLPTIISVYDDPAVKRAQPIIPSWKNVFLNAVPRPSAPTKVKYNEVSSLFWNAVHEVLSGDSTAADSLEVLEVQLEDLKGGSAW